MAFIKYGSLGSARLEPVFLHELLEAAHLPHGHPCRPATEKDERADAFVGGPTKPVQVSSSLPSAEKIDARSKSRATSGSSRSRSSMSATRSSASASRPAQGVGEWRNTAFGVGRQIANALECVDGVI